MTEPDWIAVDWGTTNLRAWAVLGDGSVVDRSEAELGISQVAPGSFEPALVSVVERWLPDGRRTPVIACGMVGSDRGWVHAPYREAPCAPVAQGGLASTAVRDWRLDVAVVPGIKMTHPSPDVMRGEETQVAGLLASFPEFDGLVCLPGTHTKWAVVGSGMISSFRTFMTGELFDILSRHSLLRHSVDPSAWDEGSFASAVKLGMSNPGSISAHLFSIRSESLLRGLGPAAAASRLSGLLIGAELASVRHLRSGGELVVLGSGKAGSAYRSALRVAGVAFRTLDAERAVLDGLGHARRLLDRSA